MNHESQSEGEHKTDTAGSVQGGHAPQSEPEAARGSSAVLCKGCGYVLSGLGSEGVCPECGTAVSLSKQGDRLEYAAAGYLRSLHIGIVINLVAMGLSVLYVLAIIGFIITAVALDKQHWLTGRTFEWVNMLVVMPIVILAIWGWWVFSVPDPSRHGNENGEKPRRLLRITVMIMAAALAVEMAAGTLEISNVWMPWSSYVNYAAGGTSQIVWIVSYFAGLLYMKWLARRIPNERVERWAGHMMWLGPLLCTVGCIALMLGPVAATVIYCMILEWMRVDLKYLHLRAVAREAGTLPA